MKYPSLALLAGLVILPTVSNAAVIRIDEGAFTADAGLITFSEKPINTVDPTYLPADYGGGAGAPTVTFAGFFTGQSLGGAVCGGAPTGCVVGSPSGPLSLDGASPDTFITNDGANPTSPVLSGSPTFNGPIAMLFSVDLAGVGLDGGFFNAIGGTAITAFARDGSVIGQVQNIGLGIEFLGLVTDDGTEQIAGLLFSLVGPEPAGFAIDNLRFGRAGQVVVPGGEVPEPATLLLLASGCALIAARRRRQ
jgi:PEP-CTERM motif